MFLILLLMAQTPFVEPPPRNIPVMSGMPTIGFAANSGEGPEGTSPVTVKVVLDRPTDQQVSVFYTTSGSATQGQDYALTNGIITMAPGQTVSTLVFPILNDKQPEGDETITINLSNASNAVLGQSFYNYYTHTIHDND